MLENNVRPSRVLARGLVIAAALCGGAAVAQPSEQIDVNADANQLTRTRLVATADLDLAAPGRQRALERRLRVAAAYVCNARDAAVSRHYEGLTACVDQAMTDGLAQARQRTAGNDAAPIRVTAG